MHLLLLKIPLCNHSIPVFFFYRRGTVIEAVPRGVAHSGTLSGVSCHIKYIFFKLLHFCQLCVLFCIVHLFYLFIYFVIVCRWLLMLVFHFYPMGDVLCWPGRSSIFTRHHCGTFTRTYISMMLQILRNGMAIGADTQKPKLFLSHC